MARKILYTGLAALAAACGNDDQNQAALRGPASEVSARGDSTETDATAPAPAPTVLVLGTSLTAGLGLTADRAYPALIQAKIDSAGLGYRVVNAGVSGGTSAGGLRRIDWLLRQPVSVLVLELGANDMLRGQELSALRGNLQEIIDRTRGVYPEARIVIAGLQAAPNLGEPYASEFAAVFAELARANEAALVPFLLEGVAGIPGLNLADGNHPTAAGHAIVADNVWVVLEPVLREIASP